MKKGAILTLVFLFLMVASVNAQEKGPVAISPGNDMGVAVVGQSTPTFSWTAVDWATTYRVEVFAAPEGQVLHYKEMAAQAYPLLVKEIRGAATAWTPSAEEQLSNSGVYVWYVQAMNDLGTAVWSEGKAFTVNLAAAFAPLEDAVSDSLRENGISPDVIDNVLSDVKTKVGERAVAAGTDNPIPISIQGTENANNTFYGLYSGAVTTGSYNSFFGTYAGNRNTTGQGNTFLGRRAGELNLTGSNNTFVGYQAGYSSTGSGNVFMGYFTGVNNTSGVYNTFVGYAAGDSNTTASYNSFFGHQSGQSNTTGAGNSIFGFYAGYLNTSGGSNTFIGREAGYSNTAGSSNTFLGYRAGYSNTASWNTFIGYQAGYNNTSGAYNAFLGYFAGYANTTGSYNQFLGYLSGRNNTTGTMNTFVGFDAGYSNTEGSTNVNVGYRAGYTNQTGNGNVFLGHLAGENFIGSNRLYIDNTNTDSPLIWGNFAADTVALMGTVGIGTKTPAFPMEMKKTGTNASIVVDRTDGATNYINATDTSGNFGTVTNHVLRLVVNSLWRMRLHTDDSLTMRNGASCSAGGTWTNASSRDLKENIRELDSEDAFATLENLNPVQYNYKADKEEDYIGFIAEDVPDLVATKDKKGMATMDVVAVLTKVVQEQQKTVEKQQKTVEEQQDLVTAQQKALAELQEANRNLLNRLEELERKTKDK